MSGRVWTGTAGIVTRDAIRKPRSFFGEAGPWLVVGDRKTNRFLHYFTRDLFDARTVLIGTSVDFDFIADFNEGRNL